MRAEASFHVYFVVDQGGKMEKIPINLIEDVIHLIMEVKYSGSKAS